MKRLTYLVITMTATLFGCGGGNPDADGTGGGGGNAGAGGSGTSSSGGSTVDSNELFEICSAYGEAYFASGCVPANVTRDQIIAQCFSQGAAYEKGCGTEALAQLACAASGGFTCLNGNPYPNSTCVAEATAFQMCALALPCKNYCAAAEAAGCALPNCFESCTAITGVGTDCGSDYSQLYYCQTQALTCENGKPSVKDCGDQVARIGWCVSTYSASNNDCEGYCAMADLLGCGNGCQADCKAKVEDPKCGGTYSNVLNCAVDLIDLQVACVGGKLAPTAACDFSVMEYEQCLQMP